MANERDEQVCYHEVCSCKVQNESDYCSPQCEAASQSDVTSVICECGHPNCAGEPNA